MSHHPDCVNNGLVHRTDQRLSKSTVSSILAPQPSYRYHPARASLGGLPLHLCLLNVTIVDLKLFTKLLGYGWFPR